MNGRIDQTTYECSKEQCHKNNRPESDILPVQVPGGSKCDEIPMFILNMCLIYLPFLIQWFEFIGKNVIDVTLDENSRNLRELLS